jgi:uncharacterized coiled-coil DUF342 family protein
VTTQQHTQRLITKVLELEAEVERLREQLYEETVAFNAEVVRLRDRLDECREIVDNHVAEVRRLREALTSCACNCQWVNEQRAYHCLRCKALAGVSE